MKPQVAVIGAGPCGLMAAERLAEQGQVHVTVYDRMPSPARKLLIAGRGGLNLTHSEPLESFLPRYGAAADWLAPAIEAFPPQGLRQWCEGLGIPTMVGSSGRVFPQGMKASPLLRAWLHRLEALGVTYAPRHSWCGWKDGALHFLDARQQEVMVRPDATLLALGGASWPRLGSNGAWVRLLEMQGVPVVPLQPANSGFVVAWSDYFSTRFAGQPLKPLAITHGAIRRQGEAMITSRGIEGGLVYALGSVLRDAIARDGYAEILLDVRPAMPLEAVQRKLAAPRGNKSLSSYLRSAGFSALEVGMLHETTPAAWLREADGDGLATRLKAMPLRVIAPSGMARAISSAGGIPRSAMTEHWMLRQLPGVFAAGEMLDWEAPTGGYLLQACFSTGVAAAHGVMQYIAQR